jgi:hypothetical protein
MVAVAVYARQICDCCVMEGSMAPCALEDSTVAS